MKKKKISTSMFSWGYALFTMVFLMSQCANLSSLLLVNDDTIETVEQAQAEGMSICTLNYQSQTYKKADKVYEWANETEAIETLFADDHTCDVLINFESILIDSIAQKMNMCGRYTRMPKNMLLNQSSFGVRPEFLKTINY